VQVDVDGFTLAVVDAVDLGQLDQVGLAVADLEAGLGA
jgi:hypothetical protein